MTDLTATLVGQDLAALREAGYSGEFTDFGPDCFDAPRYRLEVRQKGKNPVAFNHDDPLAILADLAVYIPEIRRLREKLR